LPLLKFQPSYLLTHYLPRKWTWRNPRLQKEPYRFRWTISFYRDHVFRSKCNVSCENTAM